MDILHLEIREKKKGGGEQIGYLCDKNQKHQWNSNKKNHSVIKSEIEYIFPKRWTEANYKG